MPLTVKQMLDYNDLTLLQTGDLSTTARRLTDLMEASGDFLTPFSNSVRVALEQIFVEEVSRGRIEGAFALALAGGVIDPPYPAPFGFVWLPETYQGQQTYYLDQPVIYLARAA